MTYYADPTIIIIDWSPEGHGTVLSPAIYRLLEDHYVNNNLLFAGATVTEGIDVPFGWIPTPNVDPLNSKALGIFYALGPRDQGLIRQQYQPTNVLPPATFWRQISPNLYQLTGLGVGMNPKFAITNHPIGNIPQ